MPQELITQAEIASTVAQKPPTDAEKRILKKLSEDQVTVEVCIPEDIGKTDFNVTLSAVCKTLVKAHLQEEILMPALGRLLQVATEHPELYQTEEIPTFEDFVAEIGKTYGVGRSTCYDARKLASRWGHVIDVEQFRKIGRVKMQIVSKAVGKGDEGKAYVKKLLEVAATGTAENLKDFATTKGYLSSGESEGTFFKIGCNKAQARRFRRWFDNPAVKAFAGSEGEAEILDHMIEECSNEWLEKGQAILEEQKESESETESEEATA